MISGVLLIFAKAGLAESEMKQGIVFKKLQDTIVSEDEWRIVLDFDMLEIKKELITLKSMCKDLVYHLNTSVNVWDEDFDFEYDKIKTGIDQYESDVTDVFRLLPTERSKRGLINAGGYVLKWLFGLPTSEDMELVNSKVEELKLISGSLVNSKEHQITLMKDMNEKMVTNTKAIAEVMSKLTQSNSLLITSLQGFEQQNIMLHRSLAKHLRFVSFVRHLGQTVDEAKLRIVEFRQALELVNTGRLSSKLLPPHDFIKILSNVEKVIPPSLKLIVPINEEDIFMYYSFCNVHALATKSGIRLIVTVPLSSPDRQFELYKVEVIPLYQPKLQHWLKWNVKNDYLLISKDRQYYIPIDVLDLYQCRLTHFYLCPNSLSVLHHSVSDCLFLLFMGSNLATEKCSRILTENITSPVWIQNGNDWIYSLKEPYEIVLNCVRSSDDETSDNLPQVDYLELTINNSGIIKQVSSCDIFGKYNKLFSRVQGNIKYQYNITHLHIPKMNLLLPHEEHLIFENNSITFQTLQKVKENLQDNHIEFELNKLLNNKYDACANLSSDLQPSSNYSIYLIAFMCILNCILLVVLFCHRKIQNYCSRVAVAAEQQQAPTSTIRVEQGTPLAEIIQESSFVKFNSPTPSC